MSTYIRGIPFNVFYTFSPSDSRFAIKKTSASLRTFKYDASEAEFLLGDSINLDLSYDFDIRQLLCFETNLFILFYVEKSKVIVLFNILRYQAILECSSQRVFGLNDIQYYNLYLY